MGFYIRAQYLQMVGIKFNTKGKVKGHVSLYTGNLW